MKPRNIKKMWVWLLPFLLVMPMVASAGETAEDTVGAADVGRKIREALSAVGEYSARKRDEAVEKVKQALGTLDARIDRLEERLDEQWAAMDRTSRKKARETLKTLREKRKQLAEWYGGLRHGSADAWEQVKNGLLKTFESLKQTFDQAEDELEGEHVI